MKRYYFDVRLGDQLTPDEEGMEFPNIETVQREAALSLADVIKDHMQRRQNAGNGLAPLFAIEVRDDDGPVLQARFTFELAKAKH
jgi:hypothetical protein